jgi:hypothetical protein
MGMYSSKDKKPEKKAGVTEKDKAVLDLKVARDKLKRYQKTLEVDTVKLNSKCKILLKAGQKERALIVLKVRKYKEDAYNNVDTQLLSVLHLIDDVEWADQRNDVLRALQEGTKALKQLNSEMPVEKVEALMEESEEARRVQDEIGTMLGSLGATTVEEDAALEDELLELVGVTKDTINPDPEKTAFPEAPKVPVMPSVPTHTTSVQPADEDRKNLIAS